MSVLAAPATESRSPTCRYVSESSWRISGQAASRIPKTSSSRNSIARNTATGVMAMEGRQPNGLGRRMCRGYRTRRLSVSGRMRRMNVPRDAEIPRRDG